MTRGLGGLSTIVGVLVATSVAAGAAPAPDPLDKPAYSATAQELLTAGRQALAAEEHTDATAVTLREEMTIELDAQGRAHRHTRMVFVVKTQGAVDAWNKIDVEWHPFYQHKPSARARVIAPSGQAVELDPAQITDKATRSPMANVSSDKHTLEAILPALVVGSVVEESYDVDDREPLFAAGTVGANIIGGYAPFERSIYTISWPTDHGVRVATRGFAQAPKPRERTANGRTTWTYDIGRTAPLVERPDGVPSDVATWPAISYATGASWQGVAAAYAAIIDHKLAEGAVTFPQELLGATGRRAVVRATGWLHQSVGFTGIDLSENTLTPLTPAQTLAASYGDCIEKAMVLVSVLRAAGVRADVALLQSGPGLDTDPQLPGIGQLDQAIVRAVVDGTPMWIDSSESFAPVDRLPARDQGRRALVLAADTKDLVTTPAASAKDNLLQERRTYHAAEQNYATATEVSSGTGVYVDEQRAWIVGKSHDDAQASYDEYTRGSYDAPLDSFDFTDPYDLENPYTLTLRIGETARVFTGRTQIDVYLHRVDTMSHLPAILTDDSSEMQHALETRGYGYEWDRPHVYEIQNVIELPPGYSVPTLATHELLTFGTMTLTTDRHVEPHGDGTDLIITFRLDTGKRRISAQELLVTRKAVIGFRGYPVEHVEIPLTSAALVKAGDIAGALAAAQHVISLHPREARHLAQLADIYRGVGLGAAARRVAKQGVALEPKEADAYDMLAWQLRRDTLGREYGFDMDRKGAIAAYRQCLALDHDHLGALYDFATLLAHDEHGLLTTNAKDRLEVISLLVRAKDIAGNSDYDEMLASNQLIAGKLADAAATIADMPEGDKRSHLLIAQLSATKGVADAMTLANSLPATERKQDVIAAASMLLLMRRYDDARTIFLEARDRDGDPVQAEIMSRIKVTDPLKLDPRDPKTPALQAFAYLMGVTKTWAGAAPWDADTGTSLDTLAAQAAEMPGMKVFKTLPRTVAFDAVASFVPVVDGSAADGWRVSYDIGGQRMMFYVQSLGGRAMLVGVPDRPAGIGRTLLGLLAAHRDAAAAKWMAWLTEAPPHLPGPLSFALGHYDVAVAGGASKHDATALAAAVMLGKHHNELAVPVLHRCAMSGDLECGRLEQGALLTLGRWQPLAAMPIPPTLEAFEPSWPLWIGRHALALLHLGKYADATAQLDDALAKVPSDRYLQRVRATAAAVAGNWTEAQAWIDKLVVRPNAHASDLNFSAWAHLYYDATPERARAFATLAEQQGDHDPAFENTIAAIEAASDHPGPAWEHLAKTLAAQPNDAPTDDDWYVVGRIAESVGLRDDARAIYQRVGKPAGGTNSDLEPTGYDFAQQALARLAK